MAELNAFLRFRGNCREAMTFYHRCLGGDLHMMTFGETPAVRDQIPADTQDKILHAVLTSDRVMLMGSDQISGEAYSQGTALTICLVCKSREEIDTLFTRLSAGGKVTTPLAEMFFGLYGELTDQYGFNWMFQYGEAPTT
jgi:PhnB protein